MQARLLGIDNLDEIVAELNAILAAKEQQNATSVDAKTKTTTI
ncbi:MAG: hypothetical protein ONB16_01230 [candidate division KSB1 bacterium]|nr:hypothetical protein [candidate division KSB1 bacterium]MDZ7318652.1 hypothetical protein [candidate division KSB1 bacterium]MDZ7340031.1 hypothetical protein [candidate division KSB1 bacterium]